MGLWRSLVRFPGLSVASTSGGCIWAECDRSARVRATPLAGAAWGCRRNCAPGRVVAYNPPFQYARLPAGGGRSALCRNDSIDEHTYELGAIDTSLPFAELKRLSYINDRARAAERDPAFSSRIRDGLPGMR